MSESDDFLGVLRGAKARLHSDLLAGADAVPRPRMGGAPSPSASGSVDAGRARPSSKSFAELIPDSHSAVKLPSTPAAGADGAAPPPAWPKQGVRPSRDPAKMPADLSETAEEKFRRLVALEDELGDCVRCRLGWGRTCLAFGVGNPDARLMFIGEGPGYDEDRSGEPFVGLAGQMLTRIIENVLKLRRRDVYIANVIKCRPPNNRNPKPDEAAACSPFLFRQAEIIAPDLVVALGTPAVQRVLNTSQGIMRLRGKWAEALGARVMPTFHPAYLLRKPEDKRLTHEDMLKVKSALDELPAK